ARGRISMTESVPSDVFSSASRAAGRAAAALWPEIACALPPGAAVGTAFGLAQRFARRSDWPDHLPPTRQIELAVHAVLYAAWIARHLDGVRGGARIMALNGGQGSGKSTLCALARMALETHFELRTTVISIDDLYLTIAERRRLAGAVHPLLATRGVPGTHDLSLGAEVLDRLAGAPGTEVAIPRFDKAVDDRLPRSQWDAVAAPVDVVLLEGWCVGAGPLPRADLGDPRNALEAEADADGIWRTFIADQLEGPYAAFFARIDALAMLRVPDFAAVGRFREAQEARMRETRGVGMSPEEVQRFISHYQRVTEHQLETLPERTALCFELDADHAIVAVR
ncbi:MAG: hypothetical protein MK142_13275, partial [Pseudomonadales bacterium]|nr:hypothetical protein [Pseudomonadales bacterium]